MASAGNCNLRVALHHWAALCSVFLCIAVARSMAVGGPPDRGPIWAEPPALGWPFRSAGSPQSFLLGVSYSLVMWLPEFGRRCPPHRSARFQPSCADPLAVRWPFRRASPPTVSKVGGSYSAVMRGRRQGPCVELALKSKTQLGP